MRKIYSILLLLCLVLFSPAQTNNVKSTHGDKLTLECAVCHVTENWTKIKTDQFNHKKTNFPLVGQHKIVGCRQCHVSLDFTKAKSECVECHKDVHQGTVGMDCDRCHSSNSWLVTKVTAIHRQSGFPLTGMHAAADCRKCHLSASKLRFENLSTDCYSCHKKEYEGTKAGDFNHQIMKFGTDCASCHNMAGSSWKSASNYHGFFPLKGGHSQVACEKCHKNNDYTVKLSTECNSCHSGKFKFASKSFKGHVSVYSKDCSLCHTPTIWSKVRYAQHNGFEIYTGEHKGKWSACTDCHNNDVAYKANCRKCHNFDK